MCLQCLQEVRHRLGSFAAVDLNFEVINNSLSLGSKDHNEFLVHFL